MAELLIIIGVSAIIVTTLGLMNEASHRGHSPVFFLVPLVSLGYIIHFSPTSLKECSLPIKAFEQPLPILGF